MRLENDSKKKERKIMEIKKNLFSENIIIFNKIYPDRILNPTFGRRIFRHNIF
jgi:hypothetical protein